MKHVLLVQCPDEKGLVHKIMGVLYRGNLNVTENSETVDSVTNTFFMRTEFLGAFERSSLLEELRLVVPVGARIELRTQNTKRLLILATRESHCLGDLLLRDFSKDFNAQIVGVVSQYEDLRDLVERFGIPFRCVPVDEAKDRIEHEKLLLECCESFAADYLVLAKYMRILSSYFTDKFDGRMINIHHSFLPAFIGANPYRQAYERGVKIIGATAHFVTQDLDEGPIITQSVVPVKNCDSPASMSRSGREVEKQVLAKALQLVLEDRVMLNGRRTIVFE